MLGAALHDIQVSSSCGRETENSCHAPAVHGILLVLQLAYVVHQRPLLGHQTAAGP